ncbi:MAG: hypothetical protein LBO00_01840 [Zoogloeaceae bacterium]|jgi:hypothetical protein|nr:hypothetical protein [Zoogloeaceae bacterium]
MTLIGGASGKSATQIRKFLDSRFGRNFADEVIDHMAVGTPVVDAIAKTIALWQQRFSMRLGQNHLDGHIHAASGGR